MKRFQVMGFANGIVTLFLGDDDYAVRHLSGRFGLWRWLRIWWTVR